MAAVDTDAGAEEEEVNLPTEKDLYKILGVARGAKPEEVKKAYRKGSLKHYPAKNTGDPDAKAKFQKIAEAMAVLSDDKKRVKYDNSGEMVLEDFDMGQFMNVWVGEMMEEGGMVDDEGGLSLDRRTQQDFALHGGGDRLQGLEGTRGGWFRGGWIAE